MKINIAQRKTIKLSSQTENLFVELCVQKQSENPKADLFISACLKKVMKRQEFLCQVSKNLLITGLLPMDTLLESKILLLNNQF